MYQIIKRKIYLEDSIDRGDNSPTYGTITATSFYINVMLSQNTEDMGMFTDTSYIPNFLGNNTPVDYTPLIQKLSASGFTFPFMSGILPISAATGTIRDIRTTGTTLSDYFSSDLVRITGNTDSRAEETRTYSQINPFQLNFDTNSESYVNYSGISITGVDRVTSLGNPFNYVFGADKNDTNIGTINQNNGLLYQDFTGATNQTIVSFIGEGINATNSSLSAITKEEYLFGITQPPDVENDINIDRGITTIYEKHLKLSEITNIDELQRYGKGYYNLIIQ